MLSCVVVSAHLHSTHSLAAGPRTFSQRALNDLEPRHVGQEVLDWGIWDILVDVRVHARLYTGEAVVHCEHVNPMTQLCGVQPQNHPQNAGLAVRCLEPSTQTRADSLEACNVHSLPLTPFA